MDARRVSIEIKRKIAAGEPLTQRDLFDLANATRMSGRMEDKLLYVEAKSYRAENNGDKEPTAEERLQELRDRFDIARDKAMRTGNVYDKAAYVQAKRALAEVNEESE